MAKKEYFNDDRLWLWSLAKNNSSVPKNFKEISISHSTEKTKVSPNKFKISIEFGMSTQNKS